MVKQERLNFHETFKPEKQYISGILEIADGRTLTIDEISSLTGIPNGKSSGKVKPHLYYGQYMGLYDFDIKNGNTTIERTPLGEIVYMEDMGLHEELTELLCHAMLVRNNAGASVWNTVIKKILPEYKNEVKKDILFKELEVIYEGKVTKKNFAPFTGSYEEMFSNINVLSMSTEKLIINSLDYNKEFIYLYAYILYEHWDEIFKGQEEISSTQLEEIGFGKIFGWNTQEEYKVLECMADKEIIRMNRQLMPYTILRLDDKSNLEKKLYSELC